VKPKNSDSDQYGAYLRTKKGTTKGRTTEEKRIIKPEEFGTLQNIVLLTPKGFCRVDKRPYYLEN